MNVTDYTSAQYLAAISAALRAEDMEAVAMLVRCLAIVDPASARTIYDAVMWLDRVDDDRGEASTVLLGLLIVALAVGLVVLGMACGGAVR